MNTKLAGAAGAALLLAAAAAPTRAQDYDLLHLDGFEACALAYPDGDGDGFGAATNVAHRCDPLAGGFVRAGGDCDDADPARHPGITELAPDDAYADENCDGVDGDVDLAIFVSPTGSALAGCGTRTNPCNLDTAIALAAPPRTQLYLAAGVHAGPIHLSSAQPIRGIYGGYGPDFRTRSGSASPRATVVTGGEVGGGIGALAATFTGAATYEAADLAFEAPATVQRSGPGDGLSSYGVRVLAGAVLTIRHGDVRAGNGASGASGADGVSANPLTRVAAMNGIQGQFGDEITGGCDDTSRGTGGNGGTNSCAISPSSRAMQGGPGGFGGLADAECSGFPDFTATAGTFGGNAAFTTGGAGQGGPPGSGGSSCGTPGSGSLGIAVDGAPGTAASASFRLVADLVETNAGTAGTTGHNGSGGGGGGGAGGCDDTTDSYGAGGGGGGAGGCAARAAGSGGRGGGSSIGVLVSGSTFDADDILIVTGNGGDGGAGGDGGTGQQGGLGQLGGTDPGEGANGGRGGDGARGGHAGAGAGGNGGHSFGILASNATLDGPFLTTVGAAGAGGAPGTAASGAPAADAGAGGTTAAIRICAAPGGC